LLAALKNAAGATRGQLGTPSERAKGSGVAGLPDSPLAKPITARGVARRSKDMVPMDKAHCPSRPSTVVNWRARRSSQGSSGRKVLGTCKGRRPALPVGKAERTGDQVGFALPLLGNLSRPNTLVWRSRQSYDARFFPRPEGRARDFKRARGAGRLGRHPTWLRRPPCVAERKDRRAA